MQIINQENAVATKTNLIRFADVWNNYPNNDPCVNPKTGQKAYDDQCAIRLGTALEKSGVEFNSFRGVRCEFGQPGNGMTLRAEELAIWLRSRPFQNCPTPRELPAAGFSKQITSRTGIIFFKDYWRRNGERFPTGDHIDLWNRDRLTPSFATFMRFSLGIRRMPSMNPFAPSDQNWWSDLENSRQILFWELM